MKLTDSNGTEFEMTIGGYQFPHLAHQQYDADWLNVLVKAVHPRGAWNKTDPCLLTWELAELADWFENIGTDNSSHSNIEFMEPELSFEWLGERENRLRVHLNYSLRPSWSPYYGPNEEEDLFLDFALSSEGLRDAAASLREDIEKFPVRCKI